MNARRLRTLVRREVRATLRDPFTLGVLIAVPLVALLLFGFILSTEVENMRLGVYDASRSSASRRLIAELAASDSFRPRSFESRAAIERALVRGEISAGLVIPPDFDRDLLRATAGGAPPSCRCSTTAPKRCSPATPRRSSGRSPRHGRAARRERRRRAPAGGRGAGPRRRAAASPW